jgi:peptidoglycan-associated lipoprotein
MKVSKLFFCVAVALTAASLITGCKSRGPKDITPIYGKTPTAPTNDLSPVATGNTTTTPRIEAGPSIPVTQPTRTDIDTMPRDTTGNIGLPTWPGNENFVMDKDFFALNTVYFDFDRSEVRGGERPKVEEVGLYLKGDLKVMVLVEGHCDERGTEEYNRALGERRALSVREYLINLGVSADRVHTISYGEDMPEVPGQNEAAWAKNRRGVFVLLKPKN